MDKNQGQNSCASSSGENGPQYPIAELGEAKARLEEVTALPHSLRPLVKTEYTYDSDQDSFPTVTAKEVPLTSTELAELRKEV